MPIDNKEQRICLSPYVYPRLINGTTSFCPQNLSESKPRLEYLDGLMAYLTEFLVGQEKAIKKQPREVQSFLENLPFVKGLVEFKFQRNGKILAREAPTARESISFNINNLSLLFLDGKNRKKAPLGYGVGAKTWALGAIIRELAYGSTRPQLDKKAKALGLGRIRPLLDDLNERGYLTPLSRNQPQGLVSRMGQNEITWLGHAGLIFSHLGNSVWIDPIMRPKMTWTRSDKKVLFSKDYADSLLMNDYSQHPGPIPFNLLPRPDLICITHQDADHFDLGTLLMAPLSTPIVVPEWTGHPWDVDLKKAIHQILGPQRKVIVLPHFQSIKVGGIKVTSFPFVGEMPVSLRHKWNCYFIETDVSSLACTADAAIESQAVEFLLRKMHKKKTPLLLCGRSPHNGSLIPGYRDNFFYQEFYNGSRLYPWHVSPVQLFEPAHCSGPSLDTLVELYKHARLRWYCPYAEGAVPWARISDDNDPFYIALGSPTKKNFLQVKETLRSIGRNLDILPVKYGSPLNITPL